MEQETNIEIDSQTESPKKFEQLHKVTPLSKYLAMILFILMPFVGGWIGFLSAPEKVVYVDNIIIKEKIVEVAPPVVYESVFQGGEIPSHWPTINHGEKPFVNGVSRAYSFSDGHLTFSDVSWGQIDFYYLKDEAAVSYVVQKAADRGAIISETEIQGIPATKIEWPLDENGEVSKAGTGGVEYIIEDSIVHHESHPQFIHIVKQARGDEVFEAAFQRYMDTADFTNIF